jgi:peptidoglycan/LPS O-acetylase OafA/YrhL
VSQTPTNLVRPRSGYLPTLDGWRAIAVGMVLLNHAGLPPAHHVGFVSGLGALGVDLFFAISGILICSRLLEEERVCGRISLRGFYIRRTFRIFPPAYLFLAAVAVLTIAGTLPAAWPAWASAGVFLRNYFTTFVGDTDAGRFTGHFWSLAVEEHFYLLLPGLLVLFARRRKAVLAALILIELAWVVFYMHHTPPPLRQLYWERRTDLRLNSLLFPALLALFLAIPRIRTRFTHLVTPATIGLLLLGLAIGGIAAKKLLLHAHHNPAIQTAAATNAEAGNVEASAKPIKDSKLFLVTIYLVPFLFPFVILATMLHPASFISRALEFPPLRAIGRISYSLYLWQQLFWVPVRNAPWPIAAVQRHWIALPLTVLCATASYLLVEKPCIRMGHRFAPPSTPGHADLRVSAPADELVR